MKKLIFAYILLLLFFSCEKPKGDKVEISEPKKAKLSEPESTIYDIKPSSSEVTWIGRKPSGKHTGTIKIKEGKIKLLNQKITGGYIIVDMNEIDVWDLKSDEDSHMKLTEHLKSDDFFDVANHPYSNFDITYVQPYKASEKEIYDRNNKALSEGTYELAEPTHKISGNLTMRGKTLSITFPAYINIKDDHIVAKANFIIDRTLWNVRYNEEANFKDKAQDKLIFNDVAVGFTILAHPAK